MNKKIGANLFISGTFMYPNLASPNEMSGKYQVDVTNLDKEAVKLLKDEGIVVKNGKGNEKKENWGDYVTLKSEMFAIKAIDAKKREIDGEIVGSGSKGIAKVKPFPWTFKGKTGVGAGAQALQITELVERENGASGFEEQEGYVAPEDF